MIELKLIHVNKMGPYIRVVFMYENGIYCQVVAWGWCDIWNWKICTWSWCSSNDGPWYLYQRSISIDYSSSFSSNLRHLVIKQYWESCILFSLISCMLSIFNETVLDKTYVSIILYLCPPQTIFLTLLWYWYIKSETNFIINVLLEVEMRYALLYLWICR